MKTKSRDRTIIHVDMDAFYASVEQRDHPEYRGRPVIVGADPQNGKGRGVVSAASYEARKYGIHSAQPISQAFKRCPSGIFLPVRGKHYAEVSQSIMRIFKNYTPLVEPISLDEAFLDITGEKRLFGDAKEIAIRIKQDILKNEQLTASIGIGPSKLVAKIASDLNKPDGFVVVLPQEVESFLKPLSISKLWGVGQKTEEKLNTIGIRTIGQLASMPAKMMEDHFGKMGKYLFNYARGIDNSPVLPFRDVKSVSHEITFSEDTDDPSILADTLLKLSQKVAFRLRKNNLKGKTVVLKIRYSDFSTWVRHHTLIKPTCYESVIHEAALSLFENWHKPDHSVRLLGISVTKFISKSESQIELFEREDEKIKKVTEAIDVIKTKYGEKIIDKGKCGDFIKHV